MRREGTGIYTCEKPLLWFQETKPALQGFSHIRTALSFITPVSFPGSHWLNPAGFRGLRGCIGWGRELLGVSNAFSGDS